MAIAAVTAFMFLDLLLTTFLSHVIVVGESDGKGRSRKRLHESIDATEVSEARKRGFAGDYLRRLFETLKALGLIAVCGFLRTLLYYKIFGMVTEKSFFGR